MTITLEHLQEHTNSETLSLSLRNSDFNLLGGTDDLRDEDIPVICGYLRTNPHITTLDISNNHLSDEATMEIAKLDSLETLIAGGNSFTSLGLKNLAQSKSITNLDISNLSNQINNRNEARHAPSRPLFPGQRSLKYIEGIVALLNNDVLEQLNIERNLFSQTFLNPSLEIPKKDVFLAALKANTVLVELKHHCFKESHIIANRLKRNKERGYLLTTHNAKRAVAAQKNERAKPDSCPLGKLPEEVLAIINDYVVGGRHSYGFFFKNKVEELKKLHQEDKDLACK